MEQYRPEGLPVTVPGLETLRAGADTSEIFQAMCIKCDEFHNLHLDLGPIRGIIPREEAAMGIADGKTREGAILSRVGKAVSFRILAFDRNGNAIASRRAAQQAAREYYLTHLQSGDILPAVVQNPASFGAFCDIGCGFPALMRVDRCCVSRLASTEQRFHRGQSIYAAVLEVDTTLGRISLTGRELLGTWAENAALFRQGQTVLGVVRSVMPYGTFIELTPNLSGLAETEQPLAVGDAVSVYIRSIQPDKHKIKLTVLERLPEPPRPAELMWRQTQGHLERWEYYPGSAAFTVF